MTQRPEDLKQSPVEPNSSQEVFAGLPAQAVQTLPDTAPLTLPLVDYRLISVPAEAERRAHLLSRVTVDASGVAHSVDDRSATETLLAAVHVDDNQNAALIPFVADQDHLCLILSADRPSRIGFFVGYSSLQELSAVLRMGLYPGVPLTTQAVTDDKTAEVMYGLGGIKSSETDERKWAEQVGLSTLGFDLTHVRGMFNKNHRPNPLSDTWQESPLIILPDELLDMVRHYDPNDVKKDEFQVQLYGVKPIPVLPTFSSAFEYPFGARGGGQTLSYDGPRLRSLGVESTRGLGIGFGEAVNRTAQTRGTSIDSLRAAFRIIAMPH